METENTGLRWQSTLGHLSAVAGLIMALIAGSFKSAIGYFDLVQGPELNARTQSLIERIEQLEGTLRSEQDEIRKLRDAGDNVSQRLAALAVLTEKAAVAPLQFSHFDHVSGESTAQAEISTTHDAVAVVTAYAQGIAPQKQKQRSLGIRLTVNDQPCASDKTSTRKGADGDLFVSAACITRLSASRENLITAQKTEDSVRGQVYLQYVVFNQGTSAVAGFTVLASANHQSP